MTKIAWTDRTWNPVTGCDRISPGCDRCYALSMAKRLKAMGQPRYQKDGDPSTSGPGFGVTCHPDVLAAPLRWRKPSMVFVNSMSDLFHKDVPDEFIAQVWDVMRRCPHHAFQVLTKRPQRMKAVLTEPGFPHEVARSADAAEVAAAIAAMPDERRVQIVGHPGYWITDRGRVLREGGASECAICGASIPESASARRRFCSQRCTSKAHYERSQGREVGAATFREMRPDVGEQGHRRVALGGDRCRHLVHRLVLEAFDRPALNGEEVCHRDRDPGNNALPNLRWGSQADNWDDRRRHGQFRSHAKLTQSDVDAIRSSAGETAVALGSRFGVSDTQIRNIRSGAQWAVEAPLLLPLPGVWLGTSIESDRYVWRADHLRSTPAAVRWLSLEPLLSPLPSLDLSGIDWVVIGAESGRGARAMDDGWAREIIARSHDAGTKVFVKQLSPRISGAPDGAGGTHSLYLEHGQVIKDLARFPADLQIREYPV